VTAHPTANAPAREEKASRYANRLLAALRPEDFAFIEPSLRLVSLERGRVLFEPGDDVHTTYFPCHHTMVSLLIVTPGGEEIEALTIGREGAVGGIVSAGNKPAYGRAVVQIPGTVFAIPTDRLDEAKTHSAAFGDLFARYADALLAQVMQSVACNALHTLEQRCCRWLLSTHDRAGDEIFRLTQESLAEMLGVQRTSVTAVAKGLQAAGLIRYDRGRVEVLNRAGLERAACGCYAAVEEHFALLCLRSRSAAPATSG
jgi:CRP-like cAMP-binding protein